ncbi:putative cytochrome P450 [Caenibius tardaugens NBRC 16725]|uniref:Putative cytochrome P450 n=1 Tax=Caenibius tardaugens NBRC 16725 TaxID=1219035 RepID=U3A6X2_9SPHN|nr:cytochrome P450 [Caenibius tardaugens]AZI35415.1 cytochrome P450 [Caenibius tardaugens NBRC 16725]GAD50493.1 putative cytochrome P450 [Caenibius tardaugens NBRC 16725]
MTGQYGATTAQYVTSLPAPAAETLTDPEEVLSILLEPTLRGNLYPYYNRLRELDPVYRTHHPALHGGRPCWVLTSYRAGYEAFTHRLMTSDSRTVQAYDTGENGQRFLGIMRRVLLFLEPVDHARVRKMVATTFMRRKVEEFRPYIAETIEYLLSRMEERGQADIVSDYANPLPITMIFRIFGMPLEDLPLIESWMKNFARRGELGRISPEVERGGEEASKGFTEYFRKHITDRRKNPRDDVITTFVQARDADGKALTDDELIAMCVLIFMAGHESTSNMIAFNTFSLLRNRDQLRLLQRQPELIEDGIDELIRYDASVHVAQRVGLEDVTVDGRDIPAGEPCVIMQGAANHDPAQYDTPERLDLTRTKVQHLVFGLGSHSCLGNQLAKLELRMAIPALIERFPDIQLAVPESEVRSCNTGLLLRHLKDLPVTW